MDRSETIESDFLVKFTECFSNSRLATNVVTGRENMCGIEANAEPLGLADIVHDVREMLKTMAKAGTLPSRRF